MEGISDYITRIQTVMKQLRSNDEILKESWVGEKILWSLNDNFENVVCIIKELKDLEDLIVDDLAGLLEAHKLCKKNESQKEALQAKASIKDKKVLYTQNSRTTTQFGILWK